MRKTSYVLLAAGVLALGIGVAAQQAPEGRGQGGGRGQGAGRGQGQGAAGGGGRGAAAPVTPIPLFFRETFSNGPQFMARPILVTDVTSPDRELKLYGPGAPAKPDHESGIELDSGIDPVTGQLVTWVWTGMTEDNWAVTVRDKNNYVDLSGLGRIHWRVRMRGENELRPVVKLADGTMLVGEYKEPLSTQWREDEFFLQDVPRWRVLDQKSIIGAMDASWKVNPDLTKVDEVGFTDLMRGAGHGTAGNSGVDFVEVYGKPVKR